MSLIRHLKETVCPVCAASNYQEMVETDHAGTRIRVHCNGQQFEHRTFALRSWCSRLAQAGSRRLPGSDES
jgi:hypothetical protein